MTLQLPELCEGWSWRITRSAVRCTNPSCCQEASGGHRKTRIELLLHDVVRRSAMIDVEFYGDITAVAERAQAMAQSVADEQLAGCIVTTGESS